MIQGFRRLNTPSTTTLPGTRTSLHNSQLQTSTGAQSLDLLLGNGIHLGTTILIQEDARSQYVSLFPRHFISEGLTHGHVIVAIGERVEQWLECLPVAIEQEQPKPGASNADELKIAWRYKHRAAAPSARFGHSFDLSKHIPSEQTSNIITATSTDLQSVLDLVGTTVRDTKDNVVRIVLDRVGFPSEDEAMLNRFYYNLKRVVAGTTAVIMTNSPTHIQQESSLLHYFHYCIGLKSLASDEKNPAFKEYHGMISVDKIPNFHSLSMPLFDLTDRFFKVKKKKLVIEKMHLPPDISETASRSSKGGGLCATGNKDMDF